MTARRALGAGPQAPQNIRAAQADLRDTLPGIRLPDLDQLRARGALGTHPAAPPASRRTLGTGGHANAHVSDPTHPQHPTSKNSSP
ncbi:hypothetical protein [Streptomyces monashensis]|uniref:Uncharacterized protein n=1 Tax=Streptomyces monashensis TaxID=1678012 RepID=A0A1S2PUY1_9ACTN|nr:hypothetical protein [Streptomyces monashensis]OIJ97372.1 hypothetical protein BIV23_31430 [Streptomyces monashensis]